MLSNQNHGLVLLAKRNTKGQPVRFFSQWGFKKKIRNFVLTKKKFIHLKAYFRQLLISLKRGEKKARNSIPI